MNLHISLWRNQLKRMGWIKIRWIVNSTSRTNKKTMLYSKENSSKLCTEGAIRNLMKMLHCGLWIDSIEECLRILCKRFNLFVTMVKIIEAICGWTFRNEISCRDFQWKQTCTLPSRVCCLERDGHWLWIYVYVNHHMHTVTICKVGSPYANVPESTLKNVSIIAKIC